MPRVTQPQALNTNFSPQQVGNQQQVGNVGGQQVQAGPPAPPRAKQSLNVFQRFAGRASRSWKSFTATLPRIGGNKKDRIQSQKGERFNARLKKFSQRVETSVTQLAQQNGRLADRSATLRTLSNDVSLLRTDNVNTDKFELMNARLDVELDKLSNDELQNFYDNVKHKLDQLSGRNASGLRYGDQIAVLKNMLSSAIRHQMARHNVTANLLVDIDSNNPSDVTKRTSVRAQAELIHGAIRDRLRDEAGLTGADLERHADYGFGKSVQIRMRREGVNDTQLGQMNRNLLNVTHELRADAAAQNRLDNVTTRHEHVEINTMSRPLRTLNRAVRDMYLQSQVGDYRDEHVTSRYQPIGSGAAHTVSKLTYDNDPFIKVYKEDDETIIHDPDHNLTLAGSHRFTAPSLLGIDQSSPRLLERAVVTSKYADRLNFNVVAKTRYASHNGKPGIIQDMAPGKPARTPGLMQQAMDANKAELQRQMTQLHLLDCLTAQGDRHRDNYMISVNGSNVTVTGIDSDFCMGPNVDNPQQLVDSSSCHMPGLPSVVDQAMYDQIMGMDANDIRTLCGNSFNDVTVAAAINRLTLMQQHLQNLNNNGRVIQPNQWGTPVADQLLEDIASRDQGLNRVAQRMTNNRPALQQQYQHRLTAARNQAHALGVLTEFDNFVNNKDDNERFAHFESKQAFKNLSKTQREQMRAAVRSLDTTVKNFNANEHNRNRLQRLRQENVTLRNDMRTLRQRLANNPPANEKQQIERELRHKTWDYRQNVRKLHDGFGVPQSGYYARDSIKDKPTDFTPSFDFDI